MFLHFFLQLALDELNHLDNKFESLSSSSSRILEVGDDDTRTEICNDMAEVGTELTDLRLKCSDLISFLENELRLADIPVTPDVPTETVLPSVSEPEVSAVGHQSEYRNESSDFDLDELQEFDQQDETLKASSSVPAADKIFGKPKSDSKLFVLKSTDPCLGKDSRSVTTKSEATASFQKKTSSEGHEGSSTHYDSQSWKQSER